MRVSENSSSRQFVNRATRSLTLVASSSTKPTSYQPTRMLFVVAIVEKANYRAEIDNLTLFPLVEVGREGEQVKEDPHAPK
jgi:hypothetical protein